MPPRIGVSHQKDKVMIKSLEFSALFLILKKGGEGENGVYD